MAGIVEKIDTFFGGGGSSEVRPEDGSSGVENPAGAPSLAALRKAAAKSRRAGPKPSESQQVSDAQTQAALDELFENENWEELSTMYFDIRYGFTGYDGFLLSEKQKRILGKSMGTCM